MLNNSKLKYSLAVFTLFFNASVSAVSLTPGSTELVDGITFAAQPDLGGVVVRDVLDPF